MKKLFLISALLWGTCSLFATNIPTQNRVSEGNGTTNALNAGLSFTGAWDNVSAYPAVVIAVKTDQSGSFSVQFSPDGVNVDSTLTRYYRTTQIEPPHRFTITRKYARVVFNNSSAVNQTFLRLQTLVGNYADLNAPTDSAMSQDFDSIGVRPTDYRFEVALGRRQGVTLWNKFGYNGDIDVGTEVVASWGGDFFPMKTPRTLSIVSTSTLDDGSPTNSGAQTVTIVGVDSNRVSQSVSVVMNGTTPVVTPESWLGVNRITLTASGNSNGNVGVITATATTDLTIQGQVPAGEGTSQQCIFHVQDGHQALIEWVTLTSLKQSAQNPKVTVNGWIFNPDTNTKYEFIRLSLDTSVQNELDLEPPVPFPVSGGSTFWLEATTDKADTILSSRFSLLEEREASAP